MKNNYYESPKASSLMRFFWKAAGGDRYLLERSTYSDQVKYFCLGGIVIATGVLAGLAGGYAIYTIFEPKGDALEGMVTSDAIDAGKRTLDFIHLPTMFLASFFGIVWGLIIFNIDRFIVTSTGKGDGTEAITKQEITSAIPRIIMGLIIALTISKPIEIRMFKSEIDAELGALQDEKFMERKNQIDAIFATNIENEKKKISDWNSQVNAKYRDAQNAEDLFNSEMDGKAGARGYGDEAKKKEAQMKRYWGEHENLKTTNDVLITQSSKKIQGFESEKEGEYKKARIEVDALDGLLERLKLAHEIAGFWVSLFITLLFIVIELTPIFFKMMLIKGPYDYMDENVKELAKAESGIEVVYDFYQDKTGMERHKIVNHTAEMKRAEKQAMLKAQEELNEHLIQEWKKKKLKEISENPDQFMN